MTSKSSKSFASSDVPLRFWDTLDASIMQQPSRHGKDVALYPSEASANVRNQYGEVVILGGCKRKAWFRNKLQRIEREKDYQTEHFDEIESAEFSPKDLWKFSLSSGAERDVSHETRRASIWYSNSHKFEWQIPVDGHEHALVRGELDLVVLQEPDSENRIGIEIKSITGYYGQRKVFGAKSSKGTWLQEPEPKDDNLLQVVVYAFVFCVLTNLLQYFKLVYISRENGDRTEFDIDLVPEVQEDGETKHRVYVNRKPYAYKLYAEDLVNSYKELHKTVIQDVIPDRDFELQYDKDKLQKLYSRGELSKTDEKTFESGKTLKKGDWQCSYCSFQSMCYAKNGDPIHYDTQPSIEEPLSKIEFKKISPYELF